MGLKEYILDINSVDRKIGVEIYLLFKLICGIINKCIV